jgi:hypothetical protein
MDAASGAASVPTIESGAAVSATAESGDDVSAVPLSATDVSAGVDVSAGSEESGTDESTGTAVSGAEPSDASGTSVSGGESWTAAVSGGDASGADVVSAVDVSSGRVESSGGGAVSCGVVPSWPPSGGRLDPSACAASVPASDDSCSGDELQPDSAGELEDRASPARMATRESRRPRIVHEYGTRAVRVVTDELHASLQGKGGSFPHGPRSGSDGAGSNACASVHALRIMSDEASAGSGTG